MEIFNKMKKGCKYFHNNRNNQCMYFGVRESFGGREVGDCQQASCPLLTCVSYKGNLYRKVAKDEIINKDAIFEVGNNGFYSTLAHPDITAGTKVSDHSKNITFYNLIQKNN